MSAAKFVTITPDDKYFIPEACKPHIEHSFLASDLPNIVANTSAVLECFQKDGPKGDRYVMPKICLQMIVSMGSGVGQAFYCGGVKLVNGTQPSPHHNWKHLHFT
jgi:hypothetical protein